MNKLLFLKPVGCHLRNSACFWAQDHAAVPRCTLWMKACRSVQSPVNLEAHPQTSNGAAAWLVALSRSLGFSRDFGAWGSDFLADSGISSGIYPKQIVLGT